jgi:hypothetical protein
MFFLIKPTPSVIGGSFFYPLRVINKVLLKRRKVMQNLVNYFKDGVVSKTLETIGMEVETQFTNKQGFPISTEKSQQMLKKMIERGWSSDVCKKNLITAIKDKRGNKIFYELGRHHLEVSTFPTTESKIIKVTQNCLDQLYEVAWEIGAEPFFAPVMETDEDLLVVPDERDAVWVELDGREALSPLAKISSVQFTFSVSPEDAVLALNKLARKTSLFLEDFPQEKVWRKYIKESLAGYLPDRYGGPFFFSSVEDYCEALARHNVVSGNHLIPFSESINLDISLYLRSIWWYFRLKRYGDDLCIEVRPFPRREDSSFQGQMKKVLEVVCT